MNVEPPPSGDLIELVAEQHVLLAASAVEQGHVSRIAVETLEKRPEWRDTNAAGDQNDAPSGSPRRGKVAVRALGDDPRADTYVPKHIRVIAALLHGKTKRPAGRIRR